LLLLLLDVCCLPDIYGPLPLTLYSSCLLLSASRAALPDMESLARLECGNST
jgi:hypothetical protein